MLYMQSIIITKILFILRDILKIQMVGMQTLNGLKVILKQNILF